MAAAAAEEVTEAATEATEETQPKPECYVFRLSLVRAACGDIGQAQLANASTERPQTKKGGVGVAMRTYGRCINKRAAFFSRAPPAQKATCAVRRLARRRRRKFAASHQPANFPEEIRPR